MHTETGKKEVERTLEQPPEEIVVRPSESKTTTVEIEKFSVVKELCANHNITLRQFINMLIREYIRINGSEYFNLRYFKNMAGRR